MDSNYMELDFALKVLTGLAVAMDHVQAENKKSVLPSSPSSTQLSSLISNTTTNTPHTSIRTL